MSRESEKMEIVKWFAFRLISGQRDFLQISEIHNAFKKIPYMRLRNVLIAELLEAGYLEDLKVGKFVNYYRCYRLNLEPGSKGGDYYVSIRGNGNIKEVTREVVYRQRYSSGAPTYKPDSSKE